MPTSSISVTGPTGNPPLHHRVVDELDVDALGKEIAHLVHVWGQRAIGVEAGSVVHDDHGLSLPLPELDARRRHPVGSLIGRDDLEQRHLLDRREVVHADDVLRTFRG